MDLIYLHPKTYLSGSWKPKYNSQLLFMKDKYLLLHCTLPKWLNLIVLVVERHILGHDSHDLWVHVRLQNPANIIIKSHIFSMHMGHFPVCNSSSWNSWTCQKYSYMVNLPGVCICRKCNQPYQEQPYQTVPWVSETMQTLMNFSLYNKLLRSQSNDRNTSIHTTQKQLAIAVWQILYFSPSSLYSFHGVSDLLLHWSRVSVIWDEQRKCLVDWKKSLYDNS